MGFNLKEAQVELTRTLIKDEFMKLFEKNGLEKISVNDLCKTCGISRSTFYQHFDDKYDLLETVENELLEGIQTLNKNMPDIPLSNTDDSIPRWVETATFVMEKKNYFRTLILNPGDPQFVHKWNRLIKNDYLKRLKKDLRSVDQFDLELITYSMAAATIGIYEYWLQSCPEKTPEEIAKSGSRLLWSAFYKFEH